MLELLTVHKCKKKKEKPGSLGLRMEKEVKLTALRRKQLPVVAKMFCILI